MSYEDQNRYLKELTFEKQFFFNSRLLMGNSCVQYTPKFDNSI